MQRKKSFARGSRSLELSLLFLCSVSLLVGLLYSCGEHIEEDISGADTNSLRVRSSNGFGVNLLLWTIDGDQFSGGRPTRCWYYKEHADSADLETSYRTSVRLKPHAVADSDILAALKDRHREYSFAVFGSVVPLTSCFDKGKFSFSGCLSYFQAISYKTDRAYAIAYAMEAVAGELVDSRSPGHPYDPFGELSTRVRELEIRELVDTVKRVPDQSQFGKCRSSEVAYR